MTSYVNWMRDSQENPNTEGNAVSYETSAGSFTTGETPEGAEYASVWSDAPFTVTATNIRASSWSNGQSAWPANHIVQIPNITPKTTITVTEL